MGIGPIGFFHSYAFVNQDLFQNTANRLCVTFIRRLTVPHGDMSVRRLWNPFFSFVDKTSGRNSCDIHLTAELSPGVNL